MMSTHLPNSVFRVPEAATLVITGTSINFGAMEVDERRVFEASIIKTKIALEVCLSLILSS